MSKYPFYFKLDLNQAYRFFLYTLVISLPFSIALSSFALFGVYILIGLSLFINKKYFSPIPKPFLYAFLSFLALNLIYIIAFNKISDPEYIRSYWRFIIPFYVFWLLNQEKDFQWKYLKVLWFVVVLLASYGVIQFITGIDVLRPPDQQNTYQQFLGLWFTVGAFSHHLTYGGVFIFFSIIYLSLFSRSKHPIIQNPYLFSLGNIVILISTITCMGRSIWLGLIFGGFVFFSLKYKKQSIVFFISLFIIIFSIFTYFKINPEVIEKTGFGKRVQSTFSSDSNKYRLSFWEASLEALKESPIIGVGPGEYKRLNIHYERVFKKYDLSRWLFHPPEVGAHNMYIQMWLNYGIFGFFSYLTFWGSLIYCLYKSYQKFIRNKKYKFEAKLSLGLISAFAASMFAAIFENNFFDSEVQNSIFFFFGVSLYLIQLAKKVKTNI